MHGTGRIVVAMTGASGAIYGVRFLQQAAKRFERIFLSVSEQAVQVINTELDRNVNPTGFTAEELLGISSDRITILDRNDYSSPPATASFRHDGMAIVPCSMGTAGWIANGSLVVP